MKQAALSRTGKAKYGRASPFRSFFPEKLK
jgi:hypothetical protein